MASEILSMKTINNELDFIKKAVIVHWNARIKKGLLLFANKLTEKVFDTCNAKQHYESYLIKKNQKSVKLAEIVHKLSETIRKDDKVDSNSPL